ncbi:MAG: right-handed parallel beta-helix repeat-containing protein [Kiritimatiellae bacterium]|nr:right-handed parallel beta-helix repeat-containing protein [Kiritimatiellia bacterium]
MIERYGSRLRLPFLFLGTALASAGIAEDGLTRGWLNAAECGASGSKYVTTASTTTGSRQITVADAGDFQVGQGVMVSKANIRYLPTHLWGTGERYRNSKPVTNSVEVRGYDGTQGSWVVYVLDIAPSNKPAFRWTGDLGRTWQPEQPVTHGWQPLEGGVEGRLNPRDWESGYVIAIGARDQLISRIEKIEGNVLTLRDPANRTVSDAVVRHNDTFALQAAVDRALKEKRNLFVPIGHYRLARGLRVGNPAAITIEGASAVDTVLDISEGEGSCIHLSEGVEATVRNFRMIGFMAFDERDKAGEMRTRGSTAIWGFALKHCNAVTISNTERVLVENCHASRMSGECFVAGGRSRGAVKPGRSHTKKITYLRCSVTDSARNAFNDVMCGIENTDVLNCRIVDVGGNSWEGASRFVTFAGNYVRNAGPIGIGNLGPGNRDDTYPDLGAGQTLVADNVFEGNICYGNCAIRTSRGSTQVIVRNNLFVNFGSSGVSIGGNGYPNEFPAANTTVTGNIFDMTAVGQKSVRRTAISVGADDSVVSDNQIYVRGTNDAAVTGICLYEPSVNALVHDNLVRNCGAGIAVIAGQSVVKEVVDAKTFVVGYGTVPLGWQPHLYRGRTLVWFRGGKPAGTSCIECFAPLAMQFKLKQPAAMKSGDRFEILSDAANWVIHDNVISDCLKPVILDANGSPTSLLKGNMISRGGATGAKQAIQVVRGQFTSSGNLINGFDEKP